MGYVQGVFESLCKTLSLPPTSDSDFVEKSMKSILLPRLTGTRMRRAFIQPSHIFLRLRSQRWQFTTIEDHKLTIDIEQLITINYFKLTIDIEQPVEPDHPEVAAAVAAQLAAAGHHPEPGYVYFVLFLLISAVLGPLAE